MNKIYKIFICSNILLLTLFHIFLRTSFGHVEETTSPVQIWINQKEDIKIQFIYSPNKPIIDTFTELLFGVQYPTTNKHIKDFEGKVVVTNGQRLFKFENITVPQGDFSVKYIFPNDGTHQILLRVNTYNSILLASFNVFVPHQSPPSLLNPFPKNQDQQYDIGQ